jgi:hypothetical protein
MTVDITGVVTIQNPLAKRQPVELAINSLVGICREVLVVDCGSTDGSISHLKQIYKNQDQIRFHPSKIIKHTQGKNPLLQELIFYEAATDAAGTYIFGIDADEILDEANQRKLCLLPALLDKHGATGVMIPILEFMGSFSRVRADRMTWEVRFIKKGQQSAEPIAPIGVEPKVLSKMNHQERERWFHERVEILPSVMKVKSLFIEQLFGADGFAPSCPTFSYSGEIPKSLMNWAKGVNYF